MLWPVGVLSIFSSLGVLCKVARWRVGNALRRHGPTYYTPPQQLFRQQIPALGFRNLNCHLMRNTVDGRELAESQKVSWVYGFPSFLPP